MQVLQSEFAAVNVNMSIQIMAHAQFSAYVRTGHHEDALAYLPNGSLGLGYYPSGSCKSLSRAAYPTI